MKKTIKRKVIVGAVVVAFLSSTGVAFGATDAGAGIRNWYDAQFNKAATEIAVETGKHSLNKLGELKDATVVLKQGASTSINSTRDTATTNATDGIKEESKKYIDSVNAKKLEIQSNIDNQFSKIERDAAAALKFASFGAKSAAEVDLIGHTGKEGRAALVYVNEEIDKTTKAAITDLEREIRATKSYLQGLLDTKSDATVEKINKAVDDEIAKIIDSITAKTKQLVATHQAAINNKAAELEAASKLKLEERVKELINEK